MGFQESETDKGYVIRTVNGWIADWLEIQPPQDIQGLLIIYLDEDSCICREEITDSIELESIYKICRCDVIDIFYLLTHIYNGQVYYSDFIHAVRRVSSRLNKIREINISKPPRRIENKLHQLSNEIRLFTSKARRKLLVNY